MKLFEEEYKKCLQELNLSLIDVTDKKQYEQILSDMAYINKYLYSSSYSNFHFVSKSMEEKREYFGPYQLTRLKKCKLRYFRTTLSDQKKIEDIVYEFINQEKFKLKKIYDRINSYNGIGYEYDHNFSKTFGGATVYIKSLDKNYIKIFSNNSILDSLSIVHELGHARANTICNDVNAKQKFIEVYPKFLELTFADFFKTKNLPKISYNLKLNILNKAKEFLDQINDEICEYIHRDSEKFKMDDYVFEYKYSEIKDTIVAFELYEMYLSNPNVVLERLDFFIKNLQILSEEELLNIFGLDNSIFEKNIIFYKTFERLKKEKDEIKLPGRIKFK